MWPSVLAILSRISASIHKSSSTHTCVCMMCLVTSVVFNGGEVDCPESEVALSVVHESVVETQVQPLLRTAQNGTQLQWTCVCVYVSE